MANPRQEDYGTEQDPDVSLVPDTLRTYRHFVVLDGELHPMSSGSLMDRNPYSLGGPQPPPPPRPRVTDWTTVSSVPQPLRLPYDDWYKSYYSQKACDCRFCRDMRGDEFRTSGAMFTAQCRKSMTGSAFDDYLSVSPMHKSPQKECTCGFYAHYDPYTDFYPGSQWSYDVEPVMADMFGIRRCILVRTVVEMSGKVVMGSRGVRAEKMKIIAAAMDWAKYTSHQYMQYRMTDTLFSDDFSYYAVDRGPSPGERQRAEDEMEAVADRYGIEHFAYHKDMYEKYPKPDITHLLGGTDETG